MNERAKWCKVLTDKHHVLTKAHQLIMLMRVRETETKCK